MSFDTRHKIINLEQARDLADESRRNGSPAAAFVSHMEVLRADFIQKLEELAAATPGNLFVILTDPDSPLVPIEARAELAAALRVVDYVILSPGGAAPALDAIRPRFTVDDQEEDRGRTRQLIEHVRSRSRI